MNFREIKKNIETMAMKGLYICGQSKAVSNHLYKKVYGKKINFTNPQTLNEKLMVLKHTKYWKNPDISRLADKYAMREYVRNNGCEEILTELVGGKIFDSVDDIDWDSLPEQFALKCTHGCKMNIIVDNKSSVNKENVFAQLKKWQKERFGYQTGEWHYLNIQPRIICEKYYGAVDGSFPIDYKMFCMNGKVICTLVCSERETGELKLIFMDNHWHRLPIDTEALPEQYQQNKPESFEQMKCYAERLSKPFPFVRVDFYEFKGKVLLSELTFTPAFNCLSYINDEGQRLLGSMLEI